MRNTNLRLVGALVALAAVAYPHIASASPVSDLFSILTYNKGPGG